MARIGIDDAANPGLEVLVVRKMLDGTSVAADALQEPPIVQKGFESAGKVHYRFLWLAASSGPARQSNEMVLVSISQGFGTSH
jgi:hypothetical protein